VSNDIELLRLQDAWRECERNVYHLCRALASLDPIMPMTGVVFENLTDEQVRTVDPKSGSSLAINPSTRPLCELLRANGLLTRLVSSTKKPFVPSLSKHELFFIASTAGIRLISLFCVLPNCRTL